MDGYQGQNTSNKDVGHNQTSHVNGAIHTQVFIKYELHNLNTFRK